MGEEFSASDVGGVQVVVAREALKIRWTTTVFAYSDRGPEFDLKLKRSLEKELAKVFGLSLLLMHGLPIRYGRLPRQKTDPPERVF